MLFDYYYTLRRENTVSIIYTFIRSTNSAGTTWTRNMIVIYSYVLSTANSEVRGLVKLAEIIHFFSSKHKFLKGITDFTTSD